VCTRLDGSAFAEELSAAARGQLQALGSLSAQSGSDATSLVGDVNVEHLQQRWAALAVWGVDNAPGQAAANADARRSSATELLGRVPLSATQTATVTAQLPEVSGASPWVPCEKELTPAPAHRTAFSQCCCPSRMAWTAWRQWMTR
jgi:hypothetical protein